MQLRVSRERTITVISTQSLHNEPGYEVPIVTKDQARMCRRTEHCMLQTHAGLVGWRRNNVNILKATHFPPERTKSTSKSTKLSRRPDTYKEPAKLC